MLYIALLRISEACKGNSVLLWTLTEIISKEVTLPNFTNNTFTILKAVVLAAKTLFKKQTPYKAVGITSYNLQPEDLPQTKSLFGETKQTHTSTRNKNQEKCLKAMDTVNRKFGKGAIRLTSEGVDQSTWTASSDYKSNAFTTNWSELMVVK